MLETGENVLTSDAGAGLHTTGLLASTTLARSVNGRASVATVVARSQCAHFAAPNVAVYLPEVWHLCGAKNPPLDFMGRPVILRTTRRRRSGEERSSETGPRSL